MKMLNRKGKVYMKGEKEVLVDEIGGYRKKGEWSRKKETRNEGG